MALLLAVVILYNAATMLVAFRIPVRWAPSVAIVITVCDGLISFSYLGVYSSQVGTEALGGYSMVILEGIGYFGTLGAVLAVGVFLGAALGVQAADVPLFRHIFDENGILGGMLLMVLPTVCVLVVMHIRIGLASAGSAPAAVQPAPPEPAVRLSRREREVLGLVAAGYSNTMIATRLGLSDTTVKSYVENLLLQLDAHNRAEAVAAASRLNLL
jgi:DNA-binding CsgD family transcriptional regulator